MIDPEIVDKVARQMCVELGLDPDERMQHAVRDVMTMQELIAASQHDMASMVHWSPRWKLMRPAAEMALASTMAIVAIDDDRIDAMMTGSANDG